jgi:hypothetical protein
MWRCRAALFSVIMVAVGSGGAMCQDPGRPFPNPSARGWLYNNTKQEVRYTISSGIGAVSGVLQPGEYAQLRFNADPRWQRALTVFSTKGKLISNRLPKWIENHMYDVSPQVYATNSPDAPPDEGREEQPPSGAVVKDPDEP